MILANKLKYFFWLFGIVSFSKGTFAFGTAADKEVSITPKIENGIVNLNIRINDITQYETVIIERGSKEDSFFKRWKYISPGITNSNNDEFNQIDEYPQTETGLFFYRIITINKEGIERAYPPVGVK